MAKFADGWNHSDADALSDLGEKQGWDGATITRRTSLGKSGSNGPGAIGFGENERWGPLGTPTNIATPSAASSEPDELMPKIESRGDVGFSGNWDDVFGKPLRPGRA